MWYIIHFNIDFYDVTRYEVFSKKRQCVIV
uniref:Uncharacterized protein n=1 Tax=Anguilla anguilla TaxID=7936 RepID=A0A0E9UQY6_ANGAN